MLKRYHADTEPARVFDILPAIDLLGDRVVRLEQGDFARATAYSDDPVAIASAFADAGARWLHVVDLDGSRSGEPAHTDVITGIVTAVGDRVAVEVAGGLRTLDAVEGVLAAGAARVVVGTAALRDPSFVAGLVARHGPDRIAVAIDVRDGRAVGDGWVTSDAGVELADTMRVLADAGVTVFEVTAIERDGVGQGPDLDLYARVRDLGLGDIIASAGIGSIADLRAVRDLGCAGAILGRSLYDGRLSLADALRA